VDTEAARRARRKAIKADLREAYTDEEAAPPEWVDLLSRIRDETEAIRADAARATEAFVTGTDIRAALREREKSAERLRDRSARVNQMITRLNLIAPHERFTRAHVDVDALLRPLFHSQRRPVD
jgi:hypothetical protein